MFCDSVLNIQVQVLKFGDEKLIGFDVTHKAFISELRADFERLFQPAHRPAPAHSIFGPLRLHVLVVTRYCGVWKCGRSLNFCIGFDSQL